MIDLADFFSVVFVFTRTTPIFCLCGFRSAPSAATTAKLMMAAAWADGVVQTPHRPKIGVVLVKTKPTEKNEPNPSKTMAKMPLIRFLVSLPAGILS